MRWLMVRLGWEARLGIVLIGISIFIYSIKYIILGDPLNIYNYLLNSLGYLPLNVLLVTLILNRLLNRKAQQNKLEKMNILVGVFFTEVGTWLLTYLSDNDPKVCNLQGDLTAIDSWPDEEFERVKGKFKGHDCSIMIEEVDLNQLRTFLESKRDFMLRLLENPMMLEHEAFTGLLRAVFHLTEELGRRGDFSQLPASDCQHLTGDITRVYSLLLVEWLNYMQYLKRNYPYLFSLAMRTNPFDESASVVVK